MLSTLLAQSQQSNSQSQYQSQPSQSQANQQVNRVRARGRGLQVLSPQSAGWVGGAAPPDFGSVSVIYSIITNLAKVNRKKGIGPLSRLRLTISADFANLLTCNQQ